MCVHVAREQVWAFRGKFSGAYHMQLAECHVVRMGSSAVKFDRIEITLILAEITHQGGQETGIPRANHQQQAAKAPKFQPLLRLKPAL